MTHVLVQDVDGLKNSLSGDIRGTWVPFSTTEICDLTVPKCPIKKNTLATYFLSIAINKLYPTVSGHHNTVFLLTAIFLCRF